MGGVPVLLALAVVGVDYGYQPDSDGKIDYIVQVSPEHWDQAREAGEITSVIDPSVRGRVNRIIIRIGDGDLPRDAGSPATAADDEARSAVSPAHSLSPMPPPSDTAANIRIAMADNDNDYVPAPDLFADIKYPAETLGARVMRPDPQNQEEERGGFRYPSVRAESDRSGDGQQRPTEAEAAAERSTNPNRSGEQNRSNESGRGAEDPLARLSNGSRPSSSSQSDADSRAAGDSEPWVQPPSTDPRSDRNPRPSETTRPGTQPRGSVAERDESNWSENPSVGRDSSTPYQRNDAYPTSDSAASGQHTATPSRGFGAQPMSPVPHSNSGYAPTNRGYAETPASLQDNRLAGYDRYGRPVNAAGELIPNAADRQPAAEPPPARGYNPSAYSESYPDRYAMAASAAERDRRQADAARLASESAGVPQYGRDREPQAATVSEPSSPSDDAQAASKKAEQEIAAELAAARAALQANDDAAKKQSGVSQPVFNFLLLVSLVANAYLILQMSRLLQRYRTMVANMRSASTSVG
ncbi:MAG: hypothetical protein WD119_01690 [Pirellulaceae bacterium]